jgi:NADP-dependent 3-hydroxy acid dehydrogenase YdfG
MCKKVIVITGASSGIGAALARQRASAGDTVVLAARRADKLASVAETCGARALAVEADVTVRADVDRLRDAALDTFGHVDVWVNNAGRGINRAVLDLSDAELDEMFLVNTKAPLYGIQAIVPHFQQRGEGHVINVSTVLTRVSSATFRSAYTAAKAALNVLTSNLRTDLHSTHPRIRVSLILPGGVPGEFQAASLGGTPASNAPLKGARAQTPEEVARVISGVIDDPRAEAYTLPVLRDLARRFTEDVDAFEQSMATPSAQPPSQS